MSRIGLVLESKEEDSTDDSKKEVTNWGFIFMMLKNRGFSHEEILDLSYPQFNAYMKSIDNPSSYSVVVPYMGRGDDGDDGDDDKNKLSSREELLSVVASMNQDFG